MGSAGFHTGDKIVELLISQWLPPQQIKVTDISGFAWTG